MPKGLKGARLGLFTFLGTVILVIGIFLIGNKDLLFQDTFELKAYFPSVEGLRVGSPVRLTGINVGSIKSIEFIADTTSKILITMRIRRDVQQFIKKDSRASIETEGLVGNKVLVISGGSGSAPSVQDGDVLPTKTTATYAEIIEETQGILSYIKEISREFSITLKKVNEGEGTIGKLLNDQKLYRSIDQATQTANQTMMGLTTSLEEITNVVTGLGNNLVNVISGVDSIVKKIDNLVLRVNQGEGVLGALVSDKSAYDSVKAIINNLIITANQARLGAERFADNMEALKHNWLFKGYFERRGYWERSEYERELDRKLEEIKRQQKELEKRIQELRELERRVPPEPLKKE
ncbi:MAG: MlaD family protein [Ignavibacteria bacterium]|nr:MlaD family protein [Ignavibacteria bacterium]